MHMQAINSQCKIQKPNVTSALTLEQQSTLHPGVRHSWCHWEMNLDAPPHLEYLVIACLLH